jgi:1,4-dihydroxy-2-naphthoate octaprenyltransferase
MALDEGVFHAPSVLVALTGAVLIQVGTNLYNDYADFVKGADSANRVGPVRATQAGLVRPEVMKRAAYGAFGGAVAVGLYLIVRGGWPIAVVGLVSVVSGILYTAGRYALAYVGLGDLFVLVFFGPVAVGGTYFVQALSWSGISLLAGLGPGVLAVAILAVNNVRDVETDRLAGKRTLVVRLGRSFGVGLYAGCLVAAALVPVAMVATTGDHAFVLICTVLVAAASPYAIRLSRHREPAVLNPLLGATARLLLVYSLLFAVFWNL